MRLVKQKDDWGCGIACVSMITGRSYSSVKSRLKKIFPDYDYVDPEDYKTNNLEIKRLLISYKIIEPGQRFKAVNDWNKIQGIALIAIKFNKQGNWHWVVLDARTSEKYVLDPLKKKKRKDWGRMKPHHYLQITLDK
jgi:ABC-type bacteriocin/lantibiotic exporter with double-glycine peptidase domain